MIAPTFVIDCSQVTNISYIFWTRIISTLYKIYTKTRQKKSGMGQLRQLHLTVIERVRRILIGQTKFAFCNSYNAPTLFL